MMAAKEFPISNMLGVAAALVLMASASSSSAAPPISYSEPPDLPNALQDGPNLGTVGFGLNIVSGTVELDCPGGDCSAGLPDANDSFAFSVPEGLEVTKIRVTISNFARVTNNPFGRIPDFSTATRSTSFTFESDTVLPNIVKVGGLSAGTYNLQMQALAGEGHLVYDWSVEITVPVPIPALSTWGLVTFALVLLIAMGIALRRQRVSV